MVLKPGLKKVQKIIDRDSGVYLLEIYLSKAISFENRFDGFRFPKGYYYYAGSAQNNLSKRVDRHLKKDKIIHWHIDYITTSKYSSITGTAYFYNKPKQYECKIINDLISQCNFTSPVKGFGNSDCRKCESHLLYDKHGLKWQFLNS